MARRPFKLSAMSVAELRQLRDEIQTALSGKIQMERDELQEKLDELAANGKRQQWRSACEDR